jgi:hypothetical protein
MDAPGVQVLGRLRHILYNDFVSTVLLVFEDGRRCMVVAVARRDS